MTRLKQNWFKSTIFLIILVFPLFASGQSIISTDQAALERSIEILERTNNALTQKWTPINVILTTITVVLTGLAIMAGAIFAWGTLILKNLKKERGAALSLAKAGKERIEELSRNASELLEQLKEKKKTAAEVEKDIQNIKKQMEDTVDKVRDELVVSGSGSTLRTSVALSGYSQSLFGDKANLALMKVCNKCGNVFQEISNNDPFSVTLRPVINPGTIYFRGGPLCKKCSGDN